MRCPFCGHDDTQVKDSRPTEDNAAAEGRARADVLALCRRFPIYDALDWWRRGAPAPRPHA